MLAHVNLDNKQEGGVPVDVATSAGGYFVIPNLKPGGQYQLIARTKLGDKLLAGITYTQAPNTRLVIGETGLAVMLKSGTRMVTFSV